MTPSIKRLDLIGVMLPVCLLKSKSVLSKMNAGDVLEISLQDPEVVEELIKIIERSQDQVMSSKRKGDDYIVHIKKG